MAETHTIVSIVPARASTRVAVFLDTSVVHQGDLSHSPADLAASKTTADQFSMRRTAVRNFLTQSRFDPKVARAVACPGGLLRPVSGGVYKVTPAMLEDLKASQANWGFDPPVNLGAFLVEEIAREYRCAAYVVDPVSTDEMDDVAKLSGVPDLPRRALGHALSIKAAGRFAADKVRKKLGEANLVVAHVGDSVTVAALRGGRIVDANDPYLGDGPFGARRVGSLPVGGLIDLCLSGKASRDELRGKLSNEGGLFAYLGTGDGYSVTEKVKLGDAAAKLALEGLCHQVGKEIGAMAAALRAPLDGVVLTGGLARSPYVTAGVQERVRILGPVILVPGDRELVGIAESVLRILQGNEIARDYPPAASAATTGSRP